MRRTLDNKMMYDLLLDLFDDNKPAPVASIMIIDDAASEH